MLGLAYVIGLTIYAVILIAAILLGWRWGRSGNGSLLRGGLVAAIAGLLVYLPGFWNHIPVALEHRKLCDKDAGFTVIVPAEQWIRSNGSRLDSVRGLRPQEVTGATRQLPDGADEYEFFGGLLTNRERTTKWDKFGRTFVRRELQVVDFENKTALFNRVDYTVGPTEDVRFWLIRSSCFERPSLLLEKSRAYLEQIARSTK
jgi:hypothetical protein